MESVKKISRNVVLNIPDTSGECGNLYLMFEIEDEKYLACCFNNNCLSFDEDDYRADIICTYKFVIYFRDVFDDSTSEENIWYNISPSEKFHEIFASDSSIHFGIAIDSYKVLDYAEIYCKVFLGDWTPVYVLPHVIYGRNTKNKYSVYMNYCSNIKATKNLAVFDEVLDFASCIPPLAIRYAVEYYFFGKSLSITSADEREAVAKLEMRLQTKYIGKLIGLTILMEKNVLIILDYMKKAGLDLQPLRTFILFFFKKLGLSSKIENRYNIFFQECAELDFGVISAINMFFYSIESTRGSTRDLIYLKIKPQNEIRTETLPPELLELANKFETLLQIVRRT